MGYLLTFLAILVIASAIVLRSPNVELPEKIEWCKVVVNRGYVYMPREQLHGFSKVIHAEKAETMEWYKMQTPYGAKFFTIHEGAKLFMKAFVEKQQVRDEKGWYLTTFYILEKEGYYYL